MRAETMLGDAVTNEDEADQVKAAGAIQKAHCEPYHGLLLLYAQCKMAQLLQEILAVLPEAAHCVTNSHFWGYTPIS